MGDHFVFLVDRLLTESTLEAAIESQNRLWQAVPSANMSSSTGILEECRICHDEDDDKNMEIPCSCRGSLKVSFSWICRAIYFKISVYAVSEQNNCQSFSWTFVLQFRTSDKSRKFQMPEILTVLKFECLLGAYFEHFWLTYKTGIISLKLMHLNDFL